MKRALTSLRRFRFLTIALITAGLMISVELGLKPQLAASQTKILEIPVQEIPVQEIPVQIAPTSTTPKLARSYGHFPYREDDPTRLKTVGKYVRYNSSRAESLDIEAVQAFQQMTIAAKKSGVSLMPLSGFRSVSVQAGLWARQIQRRGSKQAAARWSAPPGYSEHHTGYALDIADKQRPDTDLQISFEKTRSYQWLVKNANQYGFELSFPLNNKQGIGYEPWHWRYVGSARAGEIFAAAQTVR